MNLQEAADEADAAAGRAVARFGGAAIDFTFFTSATRRMRPSLGVFFSPAIIRWKNE